MAGTSFLRSAGLCCVIGGLLQLVLGAIESFSLVQAPSPVFTFTQVLLLISFILLLIGVIGLAYSDAAGLGRLAKIGLGIALVGSFLSVPSDIILLLVRVELGGALLTICTLLTGLGMLLAGIAVLRTRRWMGWHLYTPLICGLYIFVVLIPAFAIAQGPSFLALGGWGVCWMLLGAALWAEAGARQAARSSTGTVAPQ